MFIEKGHIRSIALRRSALFSCSSFFLQTGRYYGAVNFKLSSIFLLNFLIDWDTKFLCSEEHPVYRKGPIRRSRSGGAPCL
jgi:hypothetical protein